MVTALHAGGSTTPKRRQRGREWSLLRCDGAVTFRAFIVPRTRRPRQAQNNTFLRSFGRCAPHLGGALGYHLSPEPIGCQGRACALALALTGVRRRAIPEKDRQRQTQAAGGTSPRPPPRGGEERAPRGPRSGPRAPARGAAAPQAKPEHAPRGRGAPPGRARAPTEGPGEGPQEARGGPRAAEREPEAASEASTRAPQRAEAGGSRARGGGGRARPRTARAGGRRPTQRRPQRRKKGDGLSPAPASLPL